MRNLTWGLRDDPQRQRAPTLRDSRVGNDSSQASRWSLWPSNHFSSNTTEATRNNTGPWVGLPVHGRASCGAQCASVVWLFHEIPLTAFFEHNHLPARLRSAEPFL